MTRRGLRILLVSNVFPPAVSGGYEMQAAAVAVHLAERHDVHVLTARDQDRSPLGDRLEPRTRDAGVVVHPVLTRLTNHYAPLRNVVAATLGDVRRVRPVLADVRPDVVFVWNGADVPHAVLLHLHSLGVPVVYAVCESWFARLLSSDQWYRTFLAPRRRREQVAGILLRALTRAGLAPDERPRLEASVLWNGPAMERLTPVPPSVDVVRAITAVPASPNQRAFLRAGDGRSAPEVPTVLVVGRLAREKGSVFAAHVAAAVRDAGLEARWCFAGDGPDDVKAEMEGVLRGHGVAATFLGAIAPDDVAAQTQNATVGLIPSLWEEPFGFVALELAAARLPIVSTRVGALPILLRPGLDALFCEPGDIERCSAAIANLIEDPPAARALAESARRRSADFEMDPYLRRTESFLLEEVATALGERPHDAGAGA